MNKKQICVFLMYILIEINVFMLPLEHVRVVHRSMRFLPHHKIEATATPPSAPASTMTTAATPAVTQRETVHRSPFQEYERVDVASWVSIFFFLLFVAATFYKPAQKV